VRRLLLLALFASACGDDPPNIGTPDKEVCLLRRDNSTQYCIELYEAARKDSTATDPGIDETSASVSQPGRMPWASVTWLGARDACQRKGKRLCERDEWIDACDGQVGEPEGTVFTYGNERVDGRCNTSGGGAQATGSKSDCKSSAGTFDQSGNLREWTGNVLGAAAARGGSWTSSMTHDCKNGDTQQIVPPEETSAEAGFRCCRDR
jgi:eukaryotic-like serine/threonine-protein kinase